MNSTSELSKDQTQLNKIDSKDMIAKEVERFYGHEIG